MAKTIHKHNCRPHQADCQAIHPTGYIDLLIFRKHFLLNFTSLEYFHSYKPHTETELRCTLPWAIVNIICIVSISSYPEPLSVRGMGLQDVAVLSTRIVYYQRTKNANHTLRTKMKDMQ